VCEQFLPSLERASDDVRPFPKIRINGIDLNKKCEHVCVIKKKQKENEVK